MRCRYSTGSGSTQQPPWSSLGLFFQDDWKVSPRLTLNLGLRWDANIDFLQPQLGTSQANSNKGVWDLRQVMAESQLPRQHRWSVRPLPPSSAIPATCSAQRPTGKSSSHVSVLPGTSPEPASTCYAADTASLATRSSRTSPFSRFSRPSQSSTRPYLMCRLPELRLGRGVCTSPTTPVNLCNFQFGVTPLPVPPPPTQTDLAPGAVPQNCESHCHRSVVTAVRHRLRLADQQRLCVFR